MPAVVTNGQIVLGLLLVGIGVGMLFDRTAAGTLIGLGLGLALEAILGRRRRDQS
ncbi:MAG: hypothetical protein GX496_00890 [Firmicutes bacterium]|nr:hypothetical protein [Bacillota bacterium]